MLGTHIIMSSLIFCIVLTLILCLAHLLVLYLVSLMHLTIAHMVLVHERIVSRVGMVFLLDSVTLTLSPELGRSTFSLSWLLSHWFKG
jgi:hypothetical protein